MEIKIAHLYPDILNLYGDKGNILALRQRMELRNINVSVTEYKLNDTIDFENTDIILIGGGCDKDQITVGNRLIEMKDNLNKYVENSGIIIAVCGAYPLLGKYYEINGERYEGLDILDMYTTHTESKFIGNVILQSDVLDSKIAGFENYSGKTVLSPTLTPLGKVIYGNKIGENEGVLYKGIVATHLHGPILPKNPHLTDYIIKNALSRKYGIEDIQEIESTYEQKAHNYAIERFVKNN